MSRGRAAVDAHRSSRSASLPTSNDIVAMELLHAARVDQLITLGSPQFGAPKALVYGDQFRPWFLGFGINPQEIKDISRNMAAGMSCCRRARATSCTTTATPPVCGHG